MTELPRQLYRAEQVRELDRIAIESFDIPGSVLMERAGAVAFQALRKPSDFCRYGITSGFSQPLCQGCRLTLIKELEESVGKLPRCGDFGKGTADDLFQFLFRFCEIVSEQHPGEIPRGDLGPHRF